MKALLVCLALLIPCSAQAQLRRLGETEGMAQQRQADEAADARQWKWMIIVLVIVAAGVSVYAWKEYQKQKEKKK